MLSIRWFPCFKSFLMSICSQCKLRDKSFILSQFVVMNWRLFARNNICCGDCRLTLICVSRGKCCFEIISTLKACKPLLSQIFHFSFSTSIDQSDNLWQAGTSQIHFSWQSHQISTIWQQKLPYLKGKTSHLSWVPHLQSDIQSVMYTHFSKDG